MGAWGGNRRKLNKTWEPIAQKAYQEAAKQQQSANPDPNSNGSKTKESSTNSSEEKVEDADFEVVEDEK